ncbi:MAG: hypothetical protein IT168_06030 [Bryobacterales bacterium]|nr:hypothetical protein [Bryobacterales bacterium]
MHPKIEDRMDDAAEAIHHQADRMTDDSRFKNIAEHTAQYMASTANYLRSHDANDMWQDVTRFVQRRPAECIAAALVIGMLAGRAFRGGEDV